MKSCKVVLTVGMLVMSLFALCNCSPPPMTQDELKSSVVLKVIERNRTWQGKFRGDEITMTFKSDGTVEYFNAGYAARHASNRSIVVRTVFNQYRGGTFPYYILQGDIIFFRVPNGSDKMIHVSKDGMMDMYETNLPNDIVRLQPVTEGYRVVGD